ncbi:MarR family winged helix-turn-helix transcriptional regulator [Mucilaginibacter sp. BT774]|uniref:MarR family winged helix-turn-helix transcriptional regulator n=1 Tax=Mucilaginibacter sp. BT774 TaxID=3062276 RepID=UPI00267688BA|nr:MarR family transcriptional regulator [Mucilaginibacter sp. BT774]MDO3626767.1 MarR family transcriptional regulator [Mucilaginibacter sp. BT774]
MAQYPDLELASELRTLFTRLIKKLRKESVSGQHLSLTERSTMSMLYQQKQMLPSELAASEKITNQSMSQILNHLLELGYITRTASDTDKRKVLISLTKPGEETLLRVRAERDEWLAKAISDSCDEEEINMLKKVMGPLNKIVDHE